MKTTTIAMFYSWQHHPMERTLEFQDEVVKLVYNKDIKGADLVCDTGTPFNPKSREASPQKRIYIATEPGPILGMNKDLASRISKYYRKRILAWHHPLRIYPQTKVFMAPICWVPTGINENQKTFGISGFVSKKDDTQLKGYAVRRRMLAQDKDIKIPSMVWNFRKLWQGKRHEYPEPSKLKAMSYMYHFAIENCQEDGYFTEKIMDCFMTMTVPVYWGDPSISDKFDPDGIIKLNPEDIPVQINALCEKDYASRMPALKRNYETAKQMLQNEYLLNAILT